MYIKALNLVQYGLKEQTEGQSGVILRRRNILLIKNNVLVLKITWNLHPCLHG